MSGAEGPPFARGTITPAEQFLASRGWADLLTRYSEQDGNNKVQQMTRLSLQCLDFVVAGNLEGELLIAQRLIHDHFLH